MAIGPDKVDYLSSADPYEIRGKAAQSDQYGEVMEGLRDLNQWHAARDVVRTRETLKD
jgi:hypothetical protein